MPHTIDDLRAELFDTLKQLRDKDHPMDEWFGTRKWGDRGFAERGEGAARLMAEAAAALTAEVTQREAAEQKLSVSGDATFWQLIAEGINHHPRCMHHFSGDPRWGECMRCQREKLQAERDTLTAALAAIREQGETFPRCGCDGPAGVERCAACIAQSALKEPRP